MQQDKKAKQHSRCRIHFHIFLFIFKRNIKGPWLTKMANYRDPITGEILWRKGEWNSSHWFPQPAPWNITGVHLTKNVWWSWNGDGRLGGREHKCGVWTQDIFDLGPIKICWLFEKSLWAPERVAWWQCSSQVSSFLKFWFILVCSQCQVPCPLTAEKITQTPP